MSSPARAPRHTITRERVITGALELADAEGLAALTIRALAGRLGVKPMAIYHHVAGKEEILDAIVDAVYAEIYLPASGPPWREELAHRSRSMREALGRHPWALGLMETRRHPGPANLASHESVLEVLRSAGFTLVATAHAYAILDAFVYGFALQESMLSSIDLEGSTADLLAGIDFTGLPRMVEFATDHVLVEGYAFADSFEVGLALVLDGIAALPGSPPSATVTGPVAS